MEAKETLIKELLHKGEEYCKTSLELLKLKTLDKVAGVASTLFSRLLLVITIFFLVFILNITLALWLGDLLGKTYYGFLIIAAFYAVTAIILLSMHPRIKKSLSNTIITQILN